VALFNLHFNSHLPILSGFRAIYPLYFTLRNGFEGEILSFFWYIPIFKIEAYRMKTLSAKSAAALDQDLMTVGAFSIDQLMELAGLSVSQAGMCDGNLGPLVPQGCSVF
jgi:hypothetical protein